MFTNFFVQYGMTCSWSSTFPFFDISIRSGDIHDQSRKFQFKTTLWYHSTKTAKIFWVTLDVAMGQLMDAPCIAPSRVTQKIFAVLVSDIITSSLHWVLNWNVFLTLLTLTVVLTTVSHYRVKTLNALNQKRKTRSYSVFPRSPSKIYWTENVSCDWVLNSCNKQAQA